MVSLLRRRFAEGGDVTAYTGPVLPPVDANLTPASETIENPVHANLARLAAEFANISDNLSCPAEEPLISTINGIVHPETAAEACLAPTLALFGWAGEGRLIQEALPHFDRIDNIEALRRVLSLLGYGTTRKFLRQSKIKSRSIPCLFTRDGTDVTLIVDREPDGTLLAFDGKSASWTTIEPTKQGGWAYFIWDQSVKTEAVEQGASWLFSAIKQFKPTIVATLGFSLLGNLAALALPIFVICVYDLGIGTKSINTVVMLAIGAGIVIATNLALRSVRARVMAYFGARIDALISMKAFEVILNMPVSMVEAAPVGTQISRLKQFESMRDFFTGTLASSIVDIPFIFIFLIAIALWGGNLVWVPVSLIAVYIALSAITIPVTRNYVRAISFAKQRRNILLHEIFTKRRAIRSLSAEHIWIARHRDLAELISDQSHRAHKFNNTVQNTGELLVSIAGIVTLGLGALSVSKGSITSGALIGTMALVWRVLSPLQSTYLSLPRLEQALQTFRQIDRLMKVRSERDVRAPRSFFRQFSGKVSVQRLAFRYAQRQEAVLRGVQLEIKPGEMIAITGASGVGKTTLLRLIAGLYPPTLGSVLVDDMDLRQIDPTEWRSQIAFLPETANFFYGTLAQNIRLSRPDASDAEVVRALKEMGLDGDEQLMCEGIDRRLTAADLENFSDALKQRLALARCFIKDAPIYLLDNPAASLDTASELHLLKKLTALRGRATVLFTTFRPSHMRLADRVILLKDGQVFLDGAPDKVLERVFAAA
jgi:ABC-type bacteriocin/lantibiotic exporter with double-glycine peptidase domain